TGQLATQYCLARVTDLFPEWKAPTVPCELHTPGYQGDAVAAITLGQPPADPVAAASTTTAGGGAIIIRPSSAPIGKIAPVPPPPPPAPDAAEPDETPPPP